MMFIRLWHVLAVIVLLYAAAIWRVGFWWMEVRALAAVFVVACLLSGAGVLLVMIKRKGEAMKAGLVMMAFFPLTVLGLYWMAWPTKGTVERAVTSMKAYHARVSPLLEEYRRVHGRYPETIEELSGAPRRPLLLGRGSYSWREDGDNGPCYRMVYRLPGTVFPDEWSYDSDRGEWSGD